MGTVDLILVVVYVCGMFAIGVYARTRVKSVDDFILAGKRFKLFPLVSTLMAALIGAGMTMGVVGAIYGNGSGIIWNYLGFGVGLVLYAIFYSDKIRQTGKSTMAEVMSSRFGRVPRLCVTAIVVLYCCGSLAICINAMGRLLTYIGGDSLNISITTAVIITSAVAIGYTALGGFYSVVWTDMVQFSIMFVVIVIVGPVVALVYGGSFEGLTTVLSDGGFSLTNPLQGTPMTYVTASFVLVGASVLADPTISQRALAADTDKTAKKSFLIGAVVTVLFGAGLVFIGAGAMATIPDMAERYGTTEAAFPVFIIQYFPPMLKGLGISALIAAILSTISAMLLVASTHLVYDGTRAVNPNVKDKTLQKALPVAVICVGIIVTYLALKVTSIASVMYMAFSIVGAALMFPMMLTLYWKKATMPGVTAGIITGSVTVIIMYVMGNMGPGGDPIYLGSLISLISIAVVSMMTQKRVPSAQEG